MRKYRTLVLDKKSIRGLVNMKRSIEAVEKAFREYGMGKVQISTKTYLRLDRYNGDFRAMPAYVENLQRCALKWVNVHPENRKFNLPTVMAVIILSDPKNGLPLCVMDGTYATALRTGAAGGVAAKYLARRDAKIIAMVGCGVQARAQLQALRGLFEIKEVRVWGKSPSHVKKFIDDMCSRNIKFIAAETIEECVRGADIVVTTTPSRRPLVKLKWLKRGAHINAIGADAPGKQELDFAILRSAKLVVDNWEQASKSGEINVPLRRGLISKSHIYADIGEIVCGRKKGRTNERELTVFDSTGLAIQDVAIADLIYKEAVKKKVGKWVELV